MDFITRLNKNYNFNQIRNEVLGIVEEFSPLFKSDKSNGISLQYYDDPSWNNSNNREVTPYEQKIVNSMSYVVDTELEKLLKNNNLFRARIFVIPAFKTGYSIHRDPTRRFHMPIESNPECYFMYYPGGPDSTGLRQEYMKPDGSMYQVDTTQFHTFVNDSDTERIHIVAGIL